MLISDPIQGNIPDFVKEGGLVPFVRKIHKKYVLSSHKLPILSISYGPVVAFYLGAGNLVVTINDVKLLQKTLKMGSRPIPMFKFLEPLLGEHNMQVLDGEDAKLIRKVFGPATGHQGECELITLSTD
jgi:hypothetical protein